jgi:thiamine monophosphate synthase
LKNNSIAMLATIAGIGILAWFIGFFDPTTCTPGVQVAGWSSCEEIANQRSIALYVLIGITVAGILVTTVLKRKKK